MHLDDEKKDPIEGQSTPEVKEDVQVVEESMPAAVAEEAKEEEQEKLVLDLPDDPAVTGPGHSDYNWNATQKNTSNYSETEIANYLKDYESSLSLVEESEIVTGIVSNIQDGDVIRIDAKLGELAVKVSVSELKKRQPAQEPIRPTTLGRNLFSGLRKNVGESTKGAAFFSFTNESPE